MIIIIYILGLFNFILAFTIAYKCPETVERVSNAINLSKKMFDTNVSANTEYLYSPYTAIINSSGHGKTRLIKEIDLSTLNNLLVIYICTRPSLSSGYPSMTKGFINFLDEVKLDKSNGSLKFCLFLSICISERIKQLRSNSESSEIPWEDNQESIVVESIKIYKDFKDLEKDQLESRIEEIITKNPLFKTKEYVFLFVFDEASNLLDMSAEETRNSFRFIRSALHDYYIFCKSIYAIFMDTYSSVSNFLPVTTLDPSYRLNGKHKWYASAPIYDVGNVDSMYDDSFNWIDYLSNLYSNPANINEEDVESFKDDKNNAFEDNTNYTFKVYFRNIYCLGRPLWGTYLFPKEVATVGVSNTKDDYHSLIEIVKFAGDKLFYTTKFMFHEFGTAEFRNAALALCAQRFCIAFNPGTSVVSELTRKNMATCFDISKERDYLFSLYISEPILADAARIMMYTPPKSANSKTPLLSFLKQIIQILIDSFKFTIISAGDLGEISARIILTLVADSFYYDLKDAKNPVAFFIKPVSLYQYLNCLNIKIEDKDISYFKSYFLMFNHFTPMFDINKSSNTDTTLSSIEKWIKIFFHRCAAGVLPNCYKGIDLVIPLFSPTDKKFGCFSVQVKNFGIKSKMPISLISSNIDNMLNAYTSGFHFSLLFQSQSSNIFSDKHIIPNIAIKYSEFLEKGLCKIILYLN